MRALEVLCLHVDAPEEDTGAGSWRQLLCRVQRCRNAASLHSGIMVFIREPTIHGSMVFFSVGEIPSGSTADRVAQLPTKSRCLVGLFACAANGSSF